MTSVTDAWGSSGVTLRTVIRHAAEIIHPNTTILAYPVVGQYPQLKRLALALVQADQARESVAILQEIALELLDVMRHIKAQQQQGSKAQRSAKEILTRPEQLRNRDQELRELSRKAKATSTRAPMPSLFEGSP